MTLRWNEPIPARLSVYEAIQFYAAPENWDRLQYPDEGPMSVAEADGGERARFLLKILFSEDLTRLDDEG